MKHRCTRAWRSSPLSGSSIPPSRGRGRWEQRPAGRMKDGRTPWQARWPQSVSSSDWPGPQRSKPRSGELHVLGVPNTTPSTTCQSERTLRHNAISYTRRATDSQMSAREPSPWIRAFAHSLRPDSRKGQPSRRIPTTATTGSPSTSEPLGRSEKSRIKPRSLRSSPSSSRSRPWAKAVLGVRSWTAGASTSIDGGHERMGSQA